MLRRLAADALFMRGTELLQAGNAQGALWHLALAARVASDNAVYFGAAALAAYKAGDIDGGVRHAERALELDADLHSARDLLAAMFLGGEDSHEVLRRIHEHLRPRTYLEIGVEIGRSLALVLPQTRAIGIDPKPMVSYALPPNVTLCRETSDEYFERHDVRAELGGQPIDLAFIDGMHHFEYALRDFINIERACTPESTIVFDDCFPRDRRTAERERRLTFWSGDIWKVVLILKQYRPELSLHTVATPPCGLCIVRGLNPQSRVLQENYDAIRTRFMALDYAVLMKGRARTLNLFPNDWERIRPLLGSARQL